MAANDSAFRPTEQSAALDDAARALTLALSDLGAGHSHAGAPTAQSLIALLRSAVAVIHALTQQVGNTRAQRDMLSTYNSAWFWFWDIAHGKLRIESATASRGVRQYLDTASWRNLIHPDDDETLRTIETWSSTPQETMSLPVRIRNAAGTWNSLVWQGRIVRRGNNDTGIYAVGILHPVEDVSDTDDRNDELNRLKLDFLANISHEIRTPMTAILGAACLALESDDLREQKELARTIKSSTEALTALLGDTLEFARVQTGHAQIVPETFDPLALIGETVRLFSIDAERKGVALIIRSAPRLPQRIIADAGHIRQILVNLLSNAVKFTDKGEVEIRVALDTEATSRCGVVLEIDVRDTGIGIPADQQSSVFEKFAQADVSTKRKYGGTGLGLAICRRLAQLMDGSLTVESAPDRGSTFKLRVRANQTEGEARQRPLLAGQHVIVIEPNATQRSALCEMVTELGGNAFGYEKPPADTPNAFPPDKPKPGAFALIADLASLADDDGSLLAALSDTLELPEHRLILLRQHADTQGHATGLIRFANARIVSKPFTLRDLETALASPASHLDAALAASDIPTLKRRPLHILLAEDNTTNREVISSMLRRAGHEVLAVNDGRQAVEAFQNEAFGFDLVILDAQMPVMDGFEAAEAIRACEERRSWVLSENWRTTPILALTADALNGVAKRCVDAGMNEMLLKPSTPDKILATLERLVASAAPCGSASGPTASALFPGGAPRPQLPAARADDLHAVCDRAIDEIGKPIMDLGVALSWVGDDPRQLPRLLQSFIDELPGFIESTEALLDKGNLDEVGRLAHQMKSSLEIVGATSAQYCAADLQQACQDDDGERGHALWNSLKSRCLQLCCLMEELILQINPPGAAATAAASRSG